MAGLRGVASLGGLLLLPFVLLWVGGGRLEAQELTLSGDPGALVVRTAIPGYEPDPVRDEGTTYSLTTNAVSSIEVRVDAPLPAGVELRVRLEPPPGSVGAGTVSVQTTPQVLASSIPPGTYAGLGVQYELIATVEAGVVPLNTRQVIFTVTTQ